MDGFIAFLVEHCVTSNAKFIVHFHLRPVSFSCSQPVVLGYIYVHKSMACVL